MSITTLEAPASAPASTTSVPDRSMAQRLVALDRANDVRVRRAKLKKDLKAGRVVVHAVLRDPPEYVLTMKVSALLLAVPKYGRVKVNKVLTQCRISPGKTIGGMSERQRGALVLLLSRPSAPVPRARIEYARSYRESARGGLIIHAVELTGHPDGAVRSACGKAVPSDRASLLPDAVTCGNCCSIRGLVR